MIIKYNYINYNSIKILKHGCCRCRRKTTKLELAWLQFHGCLSEHCCRSSLAMMQKWPVCGLRISFLGHDLCAAAFVPAGQVGKGHGLVPASPLLVLSIASFSLYETVITGTCSLAPQCEHTGATLLSPAQYPSSWTMAFLISWPLEKAAAISTALWK